MYPDLSYFLHDFLGTAADNWTAIFKTYGLFLVLAVLTASRLLYLELRRKSSEGIFTPTHVVVTEGGPADITALLSAGVWGFLAGFKLVYIITHFADFQVDAGAVLLSMKGHGWAGLAGALLNAGYVYLAGRRSQPLSRNMDVFPHDRISEITMIAALSGLVGAKIFSILEDPVPFFADPAGTLLSGAGLTIYGGLIFGFVGVWWYLRRHGIPVVPVMDAVAPALLFAYGVGRLGCHFSGDGDWGIAAGPQPGWWFLPDWLWGMDYPRNVINHGIMMEGCEGNYCHRLPEGVFPTSVYEAVMAFSLGTILWVLRKRVRVPGRLFFIYLVINGLERLLIEQIRVNERYTTLGFDYTQAELIAVLLLATGIAGLIIFKGRKNASGDVSSSKKI
jgi:phosphatidylglycerol---prolipoprotein diacylglyceryl transferase